MSKPVFPKLWPHRFWGNVGSIKGCTNLSQHCLTDYIA